MNNRTSTGISTFMPETFEERDIIQPQHLTDIHVVLQDGEFLSHVSEEKVVFSKR